MAAETASTAQLDFTDVRDGGATFNKKRVPAGDYLAKVTKVVDAPTKPNKEKGTKGGEAQWLFTIELVDQYTDRKFPHYCKLESNQLWKVRNLFLAAGKAIPKKKVRLNPALVVGKLIAVTMEDDEYDGKMQSTIVQTFSPSELDDAASDTDEDDAEDLDDDEEEEEEPAPAPRRTKKAAPVVEEEDEDDEDEDDEDDEEEEEPAPAPAKRKKAAASIPAQRKASPAAKKAARKPAAKVEVDEDELEELELDDI